MRERFSVNLRDPFYLSMSEGVFYLHSVGVQTPTEIEELSLRTPRPVATTE
ncbi:hypothetical protein ACIQXF_08130 [Lysinibacillus sp. NPDC097231]|uniref:hypothetical protein n=1 Tax=Lysinibacillus sp. NPDC097231 TaxID=3364142 RepID=UPI00380A62C1